MQPELQNIHMKEDATIWEDLGIGTFLRKVRARKWLILVVPITWLIFSNIGFAFSGKAYSGELLVVPASLTGSASKGSALSGVLGGFGLDAGNLSDGSDQNFSIYLESWTSSWFAEQLLSDPDMTHRIFAGSWEASRNDWRRPSGIGSVVKPLIKQAFGGTPTLWSPPNVEDMLAFLRGHILLQRVRSQVITKISIELGDRKLGEDILRFGHKSINAHLAGLFRGRADENVSYILSQLGKVSVADYRQALTDTLAQVERQRMLAFSNPEFAAQSLALYVSANPTKPQASRIVLASLMIAVLFYLVLVMLGDVLRLPATWEDFRRPFGRRRTDIDGI